MRAREGKRFGERARELARGFVGQTRVSVAASAVRFVFEWLRAGGLNCPCCGNLDELFASARRFFRWGEAWFALGGLRFCFSGEIGFSGATFNCNFWVL